MSQELLEEQFYIYLYNWSIITHIGGRDYLAPTGNMVGHPYRFDNQYTHPSVFTEFDPKFEKGPKGVGISGRIYILQNFVPNGNAETEEIALDWISKNWVKQ
jgi:hypothetical protein